MLYRLKILIIILSLSCSCSSVIAASRIKVPVSGLISERYTGLEGLTNSLNESYLTKFDCLYNILIKDGEELLSIDNGKTTLEIAEGLKYKTYIYIKQEYLSKYADFSVIFIDSNNNPTLNLISFTNIAQKNIDSVYKKPANMLKALSEVKVQLDRIEQITIQKRFLNLIDKKIDLSLQIAEGISLEMAYVKAGEFLMGSSQDEIDEVVVKSKTREIQKEGPAHMVKVPEFYMGKYEITNQQYALFLKETKSAKLEKPENNQNWESKPVVNVSWHDAMEFTKWLSSKLLLNIRLPTEEEWEWAARGPENLRYPWGNEEPEKKEEYGIWKEPFGSPQKAGSYPKGKSWAGAYDMAGNVYEWIYAPYYNYSDGIISIDTKKETKYMVARGGSFSDELFGVRSASRYLLEGPETKKINIGFRIVISLNNMD